MIEHRENSTPPESAITYSKIKSLFEKNLPQAKVLDPKAEAVSTEDEMISLSGKPSPSVEVSIAQGNFRKEKELPNVPCYTVSMIVSDEREPKTLKAVIEPKFATPETSADLYDIKWTLPKEPLSSTCVVTKDEAYWLQPGLPVVEDAMLRDVRALIEETKFDIPSKE